MRTPLFVVAVAVALLSGCAARPTTAAAPVKSAQVTMPPSYRFDPPQIQVPAGTTVAWSNSDNFTHSVNVSGGSFPLLNLSPGQSGTIAFDQPGTYNYICTYHAQDMQGAVIVIPR